MLTVKIIHSIAAVLSGLFFIIRGFWMLNEHRLLEHKFVKVAPHIIDTLLLASALYLCYLINFYPFQVDWLTAKLLALVLYIVVGTIALKRGKTKAIRATAFASALLIFAYIIGVAVTKNVWSWLSL